MKDVLRKAAVNAIIFAVVVGVSTFCIVAVSCSNEVDSDDPNRPSSDGNSPGKLSRPMIIWFQALETSPETLRLAVSNGVFSHVMLRGLHEFDRPASVIFADPNLKQAIRLCREKGVRIIWLRYLFPGYRFRGFTFKDACDAQYYVERIRQIRKEAKLMGVELVAFDAEPYGNSTLKPLKAWPPRELSPSEFKALNDAIQTAIKIEGQVDFILPERKPWTPHLYNATVALGKLIISEGTYFDIPGKLHDKRRPADIFGAFVDIKKFRQSEPKRIRFTPREILSRQNLWAHKKGLFIFPSAPETPDIVAAVAREFSRIEMVRPLHDSNDVR